jgi:diguanylate cyclase (GGDEF)-like protein
MNPTHILDRWLNTPSVRFGTLPPAPAAVEVVAALIDLSSESNRVELRSIIDDFVAACPSVEEAIAHLLTLRAAVPGSGPEATAIDAMIVDVVSDELGAAVRNALTDPLTGLANRRALDDALPKAIARAQRTGTALAVVYFDLVGLKALNDTRGHRAGDDALVRFADVLRASSRAGDSAYRVGGDEFVAVLPDTAVGVDAAEARIGRLLDADAPAFSWGAAESDLDGTSGERLVRLADLRMLERRFTQRVGVRHHIDVDTLDLRPGGEHQRASGSG